MLTEKHLINCRFKRIKLNNTHINQITIILEFNKFLKIYFFFLSQIQFYLRQIKGEENKFIWILFYNSDKTKGNYSAGLDVSSLSIVT